MGWRDLLPWGKPTTALATVPASDTDFLEDLPLRREEATRARPARPTAQVREGLSIPFGIGGIDPDEFQYRRITGGGATQQRRDLTPLGQDKMLEIAYFLWENNCFARRLVTLMADLILGEGVTVTAVDDRNQDVIESTWNHRVNVLNKRIRAFYLALSVNGELALPVAENPISGVPLIGFIDPYQILRVDPLPDNVLVPDYVVLKPNTLAGEKEGRRLKVVRENPMTGRLEGEVFFFGINGLPNSLRGRSDLLSVADWLDLYDQYMFGEVERLTLLSSFVWDYKIDGATTDADIQEKLKKLPRFGAGTVFGHNEKETLEARTPDLKAQDRTEVARALRVHIAGSMGYPVSYLGDIDSNRSTIEGQNDVMMKTPAARQREFVGGVLDPIVRFAVENSQAKNPALFREVVQGYKINVPEISAKDISRVGQVVGSVMTAMDAALNNRTMSRQAAIEVQTALIGHLGVPLDPHTVQEQVDDEEADRQADDDARQAAVAAARAATPNPNPPIPPDDENADAATGAAGAAA